MGVVKGADKAKQRLRKMAQMEQKVIKQAMYDATGMILRRAMLNVTAAGPHLLNVGKGTLRSNIHTTVTQRKDLTTGTVGIPPNVHYGRTHELGYTGNVKVKRHHRTISRAFGKAISPRSFYVRGFTKYVHYKKRPWLSGAYKLRKKQIQERFAMITQDLLKAAK